MSFVNLYAAAQEIDEYSDWCKITKKEQRAIDRGNKIIAVLEEYYKDNGFYPQKLDELVPKYLAKIESTGLSDLFILPVSFVYTPEPVKYRPGYFKISYIDPGKEKSDTDSYERYCYDSRDDKIKIDEDSHPSMMKTAEWIDKISEEDIMQVADAVKRYFNDYKRFPEKLNDVVPEYLSDLPATLAPRYSVNINGKVYIYYSNVHYKYQNPLRDDETEFSQYYYLMFACLFDPEFSYFSDRKKWHIYPD